jgi:ribosome recycling factor
MEFNKANVLVIDVYDYKEYGKDIDKAALQADLNFHFNNGFKVVASTLNLLILSKE